MDNKVVMCSNCHIILENDISKAGRKPYPNFGSFARKVKITISDKAIVHEKIKLKAKRPGIKILIKEVVSGDEYQVLTKK